MSQKCTPFRHQTMSPLYPCGKSWSRWTHNETETNLALFSSIITVTVVIHKSRNLISTVGIAKVGRRYGQVFQRNIIIDIESLLLTEAPSSNQRAQRNKRLIVISPYSFRLENGTNDKTLGFPKFKAEFIFIFF